MPIILRDYNGKNFVRKKCRSCPTMFRIGVFGFEVLNGRLLPCVQPHNNISAELSICVLLQTYLQMHNKVRPRGNDTFKC